MKHDSVLARSFAHHQQKRLRYGAFACCLLLPLYFCTVLRPSLNLLVWNLQLSVGVGLEMLQVEQTNSSQLIKGKHPDQKIRTPTGLIAENGPQAETKSRDPYALPLFQVAVSKVVTKNLEPICNVLEPRTNFCEINRDVRVDGKSSTVSIVSSQMDVLAGNSPWTIRPYARKEDKRPMNHTRAWSVKPVIGDQEIPRCSRNHSVPAILFSNGGYTGNHFHEFTDIVVPLYITSRKYDGEVQFLISDLRTWWVAKFQAILKGLSNYEFLDIDKEAVHCFPSITVGLKRHPKDLTIDPSKHSYSMKDFREFLRNTYSLKRTNAIRIRDGQRKKPRLLIISRWRTRCFTNLRQITKMARTLGYKVTVEEADRNMSRIAQVVNSCDVLMGVHGAGLTNILFLPENSIFIQILPIGGFEWIATNYFGVPSRGMNLNYLEYKVSKEESTLKNDPHTTPIRGWEGFKSTFLNAQNIKLNVNRFRPTLLKALELLHY
ncbi:uncharacterized protein LOC18775947 [Prunus persica]|uniref:uncharacterized protein LOC18775947 n=1 Tax=Prunus persica TaxID=3760 RepID=UPI0002C23C32|nr:uncharacterized protein LOC18775947 [Prunus persica]